MNAKEKSLRLFFAKSRGERSITFIASVDYTYSAGSSAAQMLPHSKSADGETFLTNDQPQNPNR